MIQEYFITKKIIPDEGLIYPPSTKIHLCFSEDKEVLFGFYQSKKKAYLFMINIPQITINGPYLVDYPNFDFSIRTIFAFRDRLLLIKDFFKFEKHPFLLLNTKRRTISVIKMQMEITFDCCLSGVYRTNEDIYFINSLSNDDKYYSYQQVIHINLISLKCYNKICHYYSKCKSNPFLKLFTHKTYNDRFILFGGAKKTSKPVFSYNVTEYNYKKSTTKKIIPSDKDSENNILLIYNQNNKFITQVFCQESNNNKIDKNNSEDLKFEYCNLKCKLMYKVSLKV